MRAANGPLSIHVLGGTGSVSAATFSAIQSRNPGGTTERISGSDRYVLSAEIAKRVKLVATDSGAGIPGVLVFNAESTGAFYDALAASSISAKQSMPMVAVRKASVPTATKNVLAGSFSGRPRYVVSGTGWVSSTVFTQVGAASRLATSGDRNIAATQIAAAARGKAWLLYENVGLANALPDSLSGGANMGKRTGILLYTNATSWPSSTHSFVRGIHYETRHGYIFGGTASISAGTQSSFSSALNAP